MRPHATCPPRRNGSSGSATADSVGSPARKGEPRDSRPSGASAARPARAASQRPRPDKARSLKPGAQSLHFGGRSQLALFLAAVFLLKLAVVLQLKDHVLTQPDAGLDTT